MTSFVLPLRLFSKQQTKMVAAHSEENECLLKKGYSWSREATLQLISLYEEMKELFQNVNYKKKQVWEMMQSGKSGSSPRAEQREGKWKALNTLYFRKCEDHNNKTGNDRRECPFYKELSEFYGYRPNVRPYATVSSSGHGDSARRPKSDEEDEENDKERSQAMNKRTQIQQGSVQPLRKRPRKHGGVWESETKMSVFRGCRIMLRRNVKSRKPSEKELNNTTERKWSFFLDC